MRWFALVATGLCIVRNACAYRAAGGFNGGAESGGVVAYA